MAMAEGGFLLPPGINGRVQFLVPDHVDTAAICGADERARVNSGRISRAKRRSCSRPPEMVSSPLATAGIDWEYAEVVLTAGEDNWAEPERVAVRTVSRRSALLVLTDVHFPGWKAAVDGHDVPIRRVDYLLRGVPVPGGRHRAPLGRNPRPCSAGCANSTRRSARR